MIHLFRILAIGLASVAVFTGFLHLILYYEKAALDGARGVRQPWSRVRIARALSAWARETGCLLAVLVTYPAAILPRGRMRPGAWLPEKNEVRYGAPVLVVPGYFFNRSSLELLRRRLEEARRPALVIDLPRWKSIPQLAEALAAAVTELKAATGAEKVDLVCHSRGGVVARWWIHHRGGAQHVERCVTLGTPHAGTKTAAFGFGPSMLDLFPGSKVVQEIAAAPLHPDVKFIAVNGSEDAFVVPPGNDALPAPGVTIRVPDVGHCGLLYSATVWRSVHLALRRPSEDAAEYDAGFEDETADEAALRALAGFSS